MVKNKKLTVVLEPEVYGRISAYASAIGIGQSEIGRRAILHFLQSSLSVEIQKSLTALDQQKHATAELIAQLAGSDVTPLVASRKGGDRPSLVAARAARLARIEESKAAKAKEEEDDEDDEDDEEEEDEDDGEEEPSALAVRFAGGSRRK